MTSIEALQQSTGTSGQYSGLTAQRLRAEASVFDRAAHAVSLDVAEEWIETDARARYREGVADYLSVLDAERTLLSLQDQLVTTQTLTATRLIATYKAFAGSGPLTQ